MSAHSKKQVQNYVNNIKYERITGFILDEYDIILDKKVKSPMIGLYSAFKELNKLEYKKLFAISCDMPFIKTEVIKFMISNSNKFDYIIPQWNNGYIEPLFAIYPIKEVLERTIYCLKYKKFKLANLIDKSSNIQFISIENEVKKYDNELLTFININKNEDLKLIEEKKKKKE